MLRLGLGLGVQKTAIISEAAPPDETDPPVNTSLPIITGSPIVGMTLSVSDGTWDNEPASFAYQWKADGVAIDGATASTYDLTDEEIGEVITCTVTATNAGGSTEATSEVLGTWFETFAQALTLDSGGWNGYNLRDVFANTSLSRSGSRVRVTFEASAAGGGMVVSGCTIGHAALSGDAYDFDGGQVPLTFDGGNAGFTIAQGATKLSDAVDFALDESKSLIVAMHFSGASAVRYINIGNGHYYKAAANEVAVSDVTGYSAGGNGVRGVNKIEVWGDAPVAAVHTLNPADTHAEITLSNGNLTATKNAANTDDRSTRSTSSHSSGKWYFEATYVEFTSSIVLAGLANSAQTLSDNLGSGTDSIGVINNGGSTGTLVNNTGSNTCTGNISEGDVIAFAVDLDANLLWIRNVTDGGAYNNIISGSANPSTGVGGRSLPAGLNSGDVFVGVSVRAQNTQITVNLGGSPFAGTVPSGFSAWNA